MRMNNFTTDANDVHFDEDKTSIYVAYSVSFTPFHKQYLIKYFLEKNRSHAKPLKPSTIRFQINTKTIHTEVYKVRRISIIRQPGTSTKTLKTQKIKEREARKQKNGGGDRISQ